jgi:ABC-type tungstate transport system substrate-binding protein
MRCALHTLPSLVLLLLLFAAGFQKNPVPWYGIMIIDICLLLSLALFTLPLYTITSHTLRIDNKLLQQIVQQQQQQGEAHAHVPPATGDGWEDEH